MRVATIIEACYLTQMEITKKELDFNLYSAADMLKNNNYVEVIQNELQSIVVFYVEHEKLTDFQINVVRVVINLVRDINIKNKSK